MGDDMTGKSTSIEANLLFSRPPADDLSTQSEELIGCMEHLGFRVAATRVEPGEHVLFTCDRIQVLVALCNAPYGVEEFAGASRPGDDPVTDRLVLDTLRRHRASVKVLVTDRPGALIGASAHEKRFLGWELTDLLAEHLTADLIFWNDGDTLYSAGEFARAAPPQGAIPVVLTDEEPVYDAPLRPFNAMAVAAAAAHPGAHIFALSPDDGLDELERETLRRATTADWERVSRGYAPEPLDCGAEMVSDSLSQRCTNYGLLIILLALSFPVAMAVMFYQLIRGENAHMAAKALCVTALGVALNDSGMAATALSLL